MQQIHLTYDSIEKEVAASNLAADLIAMPWFAVARGALPFATMLAVKYDKRFGIIDPHEGYIAPFYNIVDSADPILIIDDVVGSGRTMERVKAILDRWQYTGQAKRLLLVKTLNDGADAYLLDGTDTFFHLPWEPHGE